MAQDKQEKHELKQEEKKKVRPVVDQREESVLIRILGKDVHADKGIQAGLTEIKGISWGFSTGLCKILKIPKNKKISELSSDEISKVEEFIKHPKLPSFMLNRQKDFDEGNDIHLHGEDIKLRKEFDIKRLKKIKSFKGQRHTLGQPVRGQRTKSHFRTNRKKSGAVGVKTAKPAKAQTKAAPEVKKK